VILFLHGWGEKGTDGLKQTQVGIGAALRSYADRYPFVVVFPQCREGKVWSDDDMVQLALATLNAAVKEFRGDEGRLYLTGLSMGGFGTWEIASRYPHKFAAIAPICGGVRWPDFKELPDRLRTLHHEPDAYDSMARKIGVTPAWVFHGSADSIIPVTESRSMVDALKKLAGNVRYTEYPGVDHDSWTKAYAELGFPAWLLQQKLAPARASAH
jgi:predicted peptidase